VLVIEGVKALAEIVNIAEHSNELAHRVPLCCRADSSLNQPT
jgi:hypothetical protein